MNQQSTPTNQAFKQTQLNFNIGTGIPSKFSNFQKPKPIVIEKLLPYPSQHHTLPTEVAVNPQHSNEKLETAMQLAKLDIKRLKSMLHNDDNTKDITTAVKKTQPVVKGRQMISSRPTNVKSNKINKTSQKPKKTKSHEMLMYPKLTSSSKLDSRNASRLKDEKISRNDVDDEKKQEIVGEKKELKELKLLQMDLEKYTKSLQALVDEMPRKYEFNDNKLLQEQEQEERKRKLHRAEEQITRSARMLYMLQRKIHDLENHLNKKKHTIRQTKKSEYLQSVSSAHRAAVRTLQMFLNHAPLYYDTSGSLPPIYTELGSLIQKLTHLSMDVPSNDHFNHRFVEDLVSSLKEFQEKRKSSSSRKTEKEDKERIMRPSSSSSRKRFLDSHDEWMKQKFEDLTLNQVQDDNTPERASTLKHAREAINGAVVNYAVKQKPTVKKTLEGRLKSSNVRLKHFRQGKTRLPTAGRRFKKPSTFAAPTVASRIREKPPVEKQSKSTPPLTPKKSVAFDVDLRTAKERDEDIILEARLNNSLTASPTSVHTRPPPPLGQNASFSPVQMKPRSFPRPISTITSPEYNNESLSPSYYAEKEISRQHWLDRVKARELRKLEMMRKVNSHEFSQLRKEFEISKHLVTQAEREICERLKPLLDRAELIAQEDEKRTEEYNASVKKRLADVASQQALSEGERLAEYILDDLLREAAFDLSSIDAERQAEMDAAFQYDRPTLESIEERLLTFEKEEETIRRNRQTIGCLRYSEMKLSEGETPNNQGDGMPAESVIRFTKSRPKLPEKPKSQKANAADIERFPLPFIDVPCGMFYNIVTQRDKFDEFLKKSPLHAGSFDPWELVDSFSEEILDELVNDVSGEVSDSCNRFVEDVYEKEFVQSTR